MPTSAPHVSRTVAPGPVVRPPSSDAGEDARATLVQQVDGDVEALGRLLAAVEPLRHDEGATIVTDADAEVTRFLAVLAVLEERAAMPAFDPDDPDLKWHAPKGVDAVPNPATLVPAPVVDGDTGTDTGPDAGGAA